MAMLKDREEAITLRLVQLNVPVDTHEISYLRGALASIREILKIDWEDVDNG